MAHVAPIYPSFARGEVSPLMLGRIDIEQYPTCLEKCRNAYIRPYGCITRLTGTEFIFQTKNSGKVRLLKFVFSPTDSYIIECGAGYFRFYQNGAPVMNGANVYEITNTYTEAQLDSIQYVQLDDIIKLTCLPDPNHPTLAGNKSARPKELIRYASNNWVFRNVTFKDTPYLDQNTTDITMTPTATTGNNITIQASADYFNSSMVGAFMWIGTPVKDTETNKDIQGFVKITGYTSKTQVTASVQSKLSGTTATKLWGEGAFSDYRGYPAVVALYDGKLYYARTPYQPRNVYSSRPYAYETFTPAVNNEDDGAINIALATNANGDGSDIKWMIGGSYLLCGTYGGEFIIRGTGDGAITPSDVSARQCTNWGGEPIQPIVSGTFVHFLQRNGNKLRQFQYDFYYDSYKAVDVSIFSEHLLASPIKEMALQKNPDSIIYLMREDGKVVMLTLEQDQSVQAWSLLEEMGAEVESIQTIPSYDGNYDEVYMVMHRKLLSTTLSYKCTNPLIDISDDYSGTKFVEGTEIVELTYNGTNGVWTTPNSNKLNTKLTVTSSNLSLSPTTTYSGTQPTAGTKTDVLTFRADNDVIEFTPPQINTSIAPFFWQKIIYAGDYIAIDLTGATTYSTDGIYWENLVPMDNSTGHQYKSIANFENQVVAISSDGYINEGTYISSFIGITWNRLIRFDSRGVSSKWKSIVFDSRNRQYIAISEDGKICYIPYTLNSFTMSTFSTKTNWVDAAFDGEYLIALSADGYIVSSAYHAQGIWSPLSPINRGLIEINAQNQCVSIYPAENYSSTVKNVVILTSRGDVVKINMISEYYREWMWRHAPTGDNPNRDWKTICYNGNSYILLSETNYTSNGIKGYWVSNGYWINLTDDIYEIQLSGIPQNNDTLTCVYNTISGYVNPSEDYNLTITGEPSDGDIITLTYYTSNSYDVRYIERMQNPITAENPLEWWYVRSGLQYNGYDNTIGNNLTLTANSGTVTATAASAIFTSSMVGNRIRFIDDNYNILGEGEITAYTDSTHVTLDVTTYFQALSLTGGKWGISTDVLSGLDHLNAAKVQVFADGKQQADKYVDNGSIDIEDAFIAIAGLPYTTYITTMPMESGSQNGTAVGKRKRISEMAIRVWNSIGVRVGRDLDNLYDTIYEQQKPFTGVIPNIKYNQGWVWDANITVEQSHPYPMNILSIAPIVTEVDK